jgi:hypothetical protein
MDLLQTIRKDRALQRRRRPLGRDAFKTVSCIVKAYGLDGNFLEMLDRTDDHPSTDSMKITQVKAKKVLELPPFSLVSEEEYRLAMSIAARLDNPYLQFAHSPEELLLSVPLYEANPSLESEDLLRLDYETLLLCQRAKEELTALEQQTGNSSLTIDQVGETEESGDKGSHLNLLRERIKQLRAFIAKVEKRERQPE